MTTQLTSDQAFDQQRISGRLSVRQQQVLALIQAHHPRGITIRQMAEQLRTFPSNLTGAIDALKGNPVRHTSARIRVGRIDRSPTTNERSIFWVLVESSDVQQTLW